jgi:DNA-binding phage protein
MKARYALRIALAVGADQDEDLMNAPRHVSHDEAVVDMLKADPEFAKEYLAAALEEAELPGGQTALLTALRHIAEAQA